MQAIVVNVKRSSSWESDKTRALAVVTFANTTSESGKISKARKGALGDSARYTKTYDLRLVYSDKEGEDARFYDDDGNFKRKSAFDDFSTELMRVGTVEEINCFDIPVSEIAPDGIIGVYIKNDKRIMYTLHPASYSERDSAVQQTRVNYERRVTEKLWKPLRQEEADSLRKQLGGAKSNDEKEDDD